MIGRFSTFLVRKLMGCPTPGKIFSHIFQLVMAQMLSKIFRKLSAKALGFKAVFPHFQEYFLVIQSICSFRHFESKFPDSFLIC